MPVIYKCPGCGNAMEFDSTTQKLGCSSCGNQISVSEYMNLYGNEMNDSQSDSVNESKEDEVDSQRGHISQDMKIYHCQSCGAELIADQYTSATFCSFCGNPTMVEDRLQGDFKPESVIPFKINKQQAVEIYRKWCKKGLLTPSKLLQSTTIEKISGLYVPFWLYNYSSGTRMEAKAERVRTQRRGDTEYIYTDHFHVTRDVSAEFERIPADASEKMPDGDMDKLEPYDYSEITGFEMPYLSGYLSERYNYSPDQIESRAYQRAEKYITNIARDTIDGYTTVTVLSNDIRMQKRGHEYALFPVWMLNLRYNNKDFSFLLNGQTGKIVANRPISKSKAIAYGVGIFALSLIITMIGGMLFI